MRNEHLVCRKNVYIYVYKKKLSQTKTVQYSLINNESRSYNNIYTTIQGIRARRL